MDAYSSEANIQAEIDAGIAAARAGAKAQARAHLLRVVGADPRHETAWLWLSAVQPTTEAALQCLEQLLTINPDHAQAHEAREVLRIRLLVEEAAIRSPTEQTVATAHRRYLLGEALVDAGVLSASQLEQALRYQAECVQPQPPNRLRKLLGNRFARPKPAKRLGEILVELGMLHLDQLATALATQVEWAMCASTNTSLGPLGDYLVRHGWITEAQLQYALAWQAQQSTGRRMRLGEVLVQLGYLQQEQLTHAVLRWHQEYELSFH